jgi:hypothetical protein
MDRPLLLKVALTGEEIAQALSAYALRKRGNSQTRQYGEQDVDFDVEVEFTDDHGRALLLPHWLATVEVRRKAVV